MITFTMNLLFALQKDFVSLSAMKAILASATIATIFFSFPVSAQAAYPREMISDSFYVQKDIKILPEKDPHIEVLEAYLESKDSPMSKNAVDFIEAANEYDLDWKLVAAISGLESGFGKHTPGNELFFNESYNGWGWGVYGTQALGFESWKDGIYTVSRGLRENYINRGLTDPIAMNRKYASSPTWGVRVNIFMAQIEEFEKQYETDNKPVLGKVQLDTQIAGESAKPFTLTALGTAG